MATLPYNPPAMNAMGFNTINTITGQTYCLTSATPCTIYAAINGEYIALAHTESGQALFIAPGTQVYSDTPCHITKCFKAAALSAVGSGDNGNAHGDPVKNIADNTPHLPMSHHLWYLLDNPLTELTLLPVTPMPQQHRVVETHLLFSPSAPLSPGWLRTRDGVLLTWLYGEPTFSNGYTYELLLTQRSEAHITACVTAITAN